MSAALDAVGGFVERLLYGAVCLSYKRPWTTSNGSIRMREHRLATVALRDWDRTTW